ncbi:hypothetical protein GW17_00001079 [Ensete ventricosum]|nr:hypothetical protein GW17_00001079 [Ensete ventricosum]
MRGIGTLGEGAYGRIKLSARTKREMRGIVEFYFYLFLFGFALLDSQYFCSYCGKERISSPFPLAGCGEILFRVLRSSEHAGIPSQSLESCSSGAGDSVGSPSLPPGNLFEEAKKEAEALLEVSSNLGCVMVFSMLQDYAYRAFVRPRTGVPYDGIAPSNLTGIKIAALRLRSGSLKQKGVEKYKEFGIPDGVVVVRPYVERLVLVYHNLGNWSSFHYPLPGYAYLTPVLGLLAYDAANLSATDLPELDIVASESPISINFTYVIPAPRGAIARCVQFGIDGSLDFGDLVSSNICSTRRQGHFVIVVNSSEIAPSPAPTLAPGPGPSRVVGSKSKKSKVWKIVGGVVGGVVVLIFLALLVCLMHRRKHNKKVARMEQHADEGVSVHTTRVGNTHVPVALETRTQPMLENELVA